MNCPRCKDVVSPDDFYCSSCGKLLKIECPRCGYVNNRSVCRQCKLKLVVQCSKCGQKNHITSRSCRKCGGAIETEHKIESRLNQFAVVAVEFLNIEQLKTGMGKTYESIYNGLFKFLNFEATKHKARLKYISENTCVLAFDQNETLYESSNSALDSAIKAVGFFRNVNEKISGLFDIELKVKIGVSISSVLDRRGIARHERSITTNDDISIIVNPDIYKYNSGKYCFEHLVSIFINNQLTSFYKLDLASIESLRTKNLKKLEEKRVAWDEENYDDDNEINFSGKKRSLMKVSQLDLQYGIEEYVSNSECFSLINCIANKEKGIYFDHAFRRLRRKSLDLNWCKVVIGKSDDITPYGLIRKITREVLEMDKLYADRTDERFLIKQKIHKVVGKNYQELEDLCVLSPTIKKDAFVFKEAVIIQFTTLLNVLSAEKKLVIVVEDFEHADASSIECLKNIFEQKYIRGKITLVISTDKEFRLSSVIPKISHYPWYTKIIIKQETNETVNDFIKRYSGGLEDNFILSKIAEKSLGSMVYVNQGLHYLVDHGVLLKKSNKLFVVSDKIIHIPSSIEDLIYKRTALLMENPDLFGFYLTLVMLGPKVSNDILMQLYKSGVKDKLEILIEKGFVEVLKDKYVYLRYFNLFRKAAIAIAGSEKLIKSAEKLSKVFNVNEEYLHPVTLEYFYYQDKTEEAASLLHSFNELCLDFGDIPAHVKGFESFIGFMGVDMNHFDGSKADKNLAGLVFKSAEVIGKLAYQDHPLIARKYLKIAINAAELEQDREKIIELSSLIVQACNFTDYYQDTIDYLGKITSLVPKEAFDVKHENFELKFYLLNFIKLQALLNTGDLKTCINLAEDMLSAFEFIQKINKNDNKLAKLTGMKEDIFVIKAKAELMAVNNNLVKTLEYLKLISPQKQQLAGVLEVGQDIISGVNTEKMQKLEKLSSKLKTSAKILDESYLYCEFFRIIAKMQYGEWSEVANIAYSLRSLADDLGDFEIVMFLDLVIGMNYKAIGNFKKAKLIYEDVLKVAAEKKLMGVMFLGWYLIADFEVANKRNEEALKLVNKVNMILEKDDKYSKIAVVSFKTLFARILQLNNKTLSAKSCAQQAVSYSDSVSLSFSKVNALILLAELILNLIRKSAEGEVAENYKEELDILVDNINTFIQEMENTHLLNKLKIALT